jgi:hypothetical protein
MTQELCPPSVFGGCSPFRSPTSGAVSTETPRRAESEFRMLEPEQARGWRSAVGGRRGRHRAGRNQKSELRRQDLKRGFQIADYRLQIAD